MDSWLEIEEELLADVDPGAVLVVVVTSCGVNGLEAVLVRVTFWVLAPPRYCSRCGHGPRES